MSHEVETMAYAGETPWHGLGYRVDGDLSSEQMLKAAKIDWTVSKREMFLEGGTKVPSFFALTRDSDDRVLSVVGSHYKETQNAEVLDFFQKFVAAGDMTLETAGSLQGGKYIWALARMKSDFSIGKQDEVHNYVLFANPHVYGYGRTLKFTSVRVVCQNTLNFALGHDFTVTGRRTLGKSVNIPHSIKFDAATREAAEKTLGIAKDQAKVYEEAARLLAKKKVSKEALEVFFGQVIGFDPKEAKVKKDGTIREPSMLEKFRTAVEEAPGHDLRSAKGTWWGAVNAVTYVVDHQLGRTRDGALTNSWLGYTGDYKKKAFALALDAAK